MVYMMYLAVIAHHLELSLNKQRGKKPTNNTINFVKAGQYKPVLDVGIIHTANDWQMLVDLRRKLVIPPDIAVQWRSEGNWRPGAKLYFAPPPLKKS